MTQPVQRPSKGRWDEGEDVEEGEEEKKKRKGKEREKSELSLCNNNVQSNVIAGASVLLAHPHETSHSPHLLFKHVLVMVRKLAVRKMDWNGR
jgi:hypothetical protein